MLNQLRQRAKYLLLLMPCLLFTACAHTNKSEWVSMFNGKDLTGWTIKMTGQKVGVNYKNTFRVEDGVLKVVYDEYEKFNGEFGHLFYNTPYSNYRMRVEYRFTGEQTADAPEWAYRNAGIMYHSQAPETMSLDQRFPVCVELQMLGGNGTDLRPTGNMCSPSSHVVINGKLEKEHCINSTSETFHGDQWVTMELEVRGNGLAKHIVNGVTVFELSNPVLDEEDPDAKLLIGAGASLTMSGGYIALQAESHPVEYRNIQIMPL